MVEQLYCTPINDLTALFPIAVATVAVGIAFAYAFARTTARKDLEGLAVEEMRQLFVSVVLALSLFAISSLICIASAGIMREMTEGKYTNQFDYAVSYLRDYVIGGVGLPTVAQIWQTQLLIKYGAHFEATATLPIVESVVVEPSAALEPISAALDVVGNFLFQPLLISLHVQLILLNFAQAFAITVFLPMGVVLRVIPQTREAGCFFLATAFGLYTVYPFLYVVNYTITKDFGGELKEVEVAAVTERLKEEIEPLMPFKIFADYLWKVFVRALPPVDVSEILLHGTVIPLLVISLTIGFIRVFGDFLKEI